MMAVTAKEFHKIALGFPQAVESSHMGHPDFRVGKKIFATLNYPDKNWGMVKLTSGKQFSVIKLKPDSFISVKGTWSKNGSTNVQLSLVKKSIFRDVLLSAYKHIGSNTKQGS